jgi:hypothetical protein
METHCIWERYSHIVCIVLTLFLVMSLFDSDVFAATHYPLLNQPNTTITAPPVLLQAGTAGASTIYANSTSAIVSVSAPITQGWLSSFQYRKKIIFNNSAIGENLVNFTVPIIFNSSNTDFWGHVQTNGNDTRFVASDNTTELYYEFEKFNHTSDDMIAWVRVPQISVGSTTDSIWVYYGNSTVNFDSYLNSSSVWDRNYAAVWHLKEDPTGTTPQFKDSTFNGNNGTAGNMTVTNQVAGKIDGTVNFNGVNQSINAGNAASLNITNNISIEAWVKYSSSGGQDSKGIVAKDAADVGRGYGLYLRYLRIQYVETDMRIGGAWVNVYYTGLTNDNQWHHVVATYNGSLLALYMDGNLVNSTSASGNISNNLDALLIGAFNKSSSNIYFNGTIDEVRISNIARSANWNKACYQYETGQSKFTYGSEEQRAQDPVLNVVNQATNAWNVSLKIYNSSNIVRISNAIINLHDGTSSDQIVVNSGSIIQSQGALHNLPASAGSTVYIGMSNLLANATGASYLYVYLKILTPNTSTYLLYAITFAIT